MGCESCQLKSCRDYNEKPRHQGKYRTSQEWLCLIDVKRKNKEVVPDRELDQCKWGSSHRSAIHASGSPPTVEEPITPEGIKYSIRAFKDRKKKFAQKERRIQRKQERDRKDRDRRL
jgi:hypothetical protein